MIRRTKPREAGFTLLEIIVALVVLSLLMLGLAQATGFGFEAWRREAGLVRRSGGLDPVDRALRRLVADMNPGAPEQPPSVEGAPHRLAFTTLLPIAAGHLATRRARVVLSLDDRHRLWLLWHPAPPGIPLARPSWRREFLLGGVRALDLAYWGPDPHTGAADWQRQWREPFLPGLVRIRLVFRRASGRHWPAIIAAPRLSARE